MRFSRPWVSRAVTAAAAVVVALFRIPEVHAHSTCQNDVFNPVPQARYYGGFNMGSQNPDGTCKLPHDWLHEFQQLISLVTPLSLPLTIFKLFSTSDCQGFFRAIPAALATNTKIWAKLWPSHDPARYEAEKSALRRTLQAFPHADTWLAGISVGSEHLHRREMSAGEITGQICDIKNMVQHEFGYTEIPVGCADTDGALALPYNQQVVFAADHVNVNAYPFWSRAHVNDAHRQIVEVLQRFRGILGDDEEKVIAFGETGWPTVGMNGAAVGDVDNAERYWREVGCWLHREGIPWVWFEGVDEPNKPDMGGAGGAEQNWGVLRVGARERKFEMVC